MTKSAKNRRPSTIVISDWLTNFRQNQWTPFEAATALKAALAKEGYMVVDQLDAADNSLTDPSTMPLEGQE